MNFNIVNNIIFIGDCPVIEDLVEINKNNNLKSYFVISKTNKKKYSKNISIIKIKSFKKEIKKVILNHKIDVDKTLFISLNSRWIFEKQAIKFLKGRLLNVHSSRLPFDKGGAYYSWMILKKDRINNQLFHIVEENIDTGSILFNKTSIVPAYVKKPVDYETYDLKCLVSAYKVFISQIKNKISFKVFNQPNYIGSYYPRLSSKINGWIDWKMNSDELERFIDAFDDPYEGAKTFINKTKVFLKNIQLHYGELPNHSFMSGLVLRNDRKWLIIATNDKGCLIAEKVLNSKGKNIINEIQEGDRFVTPTKYLYDSISQRPKYNIKGLVDDK